MTKPETRMTNQYPMIKCPNAQTKEFLGIESLSHFFGQCLIVILSPMPAKRIGLSGFGFRVLSILFGICDIPFSPFFIFPYLHHLDFEL